MDALRAVLALIVTIGHAGVFPILGPVDQLGSLDLLGKAWRTLVFGPPAVIAFFLISGFCIHYPFVGRTEACPVWRFYARRYLRILVPVVCTVVLFKIFVPGVTVLGAGSIIFHSTLWSIVCEEMYYSVYPLLNRLSHRVSWAVILSISCVPSVVIGAYYFPAMDWQDMGVLPTALVLFPVWLGGCHLAQASATFDKAYSVREIWIWRAVAWAFMWFALVLHFHTEFHQTATAIVLGAVYYFWIRAEIGFYRTRKVSSVFTWAGRWSYSLYLVHPIAISVIASAYSRAFLERWSWPVGFSIILVSAYLFYLLVERPSHRLARRISLWPRGTRIVPFASAGEV